MSTYPCDPSRKAKGSKGRCHAKDAQEAELGAKADWVHPTAERSSMMT
ncbi:MAG: hypothetical protein ACOYJJ_05190 [Anaerovoracaceae bacterium]